MLIQQHIKQLVEMAAPYCKDRESVLRLQSQIQPVKFGNTVQWAAAAEYTLALFQVPRDAVYCVIMRVECYTVNLTSGAADYGTYQPPPPGKAFWRTGQSGSTAQYIVSDDQQQSHTMLDCDEMRLFAPGQNIDLVGDFLVSPDGLTRNVRTLVYGYLVAAEVIEHIGQNMVYEPPDTGV